MRDKYTHSVQSVAHGFEMRIAHRANLEYTSSNRHLSALTCSYRAEMIK